MAANNFRAINHLNLNGKVACGNERAHVYVDLAEFRLYADHQCKKCAARLAKMDAKLNRNKAS